MDIEAMSGPDVKRLCHTLLGDLGFLAKHVPARVGSLLSTGITVSSAAVAGAIDGYLGEKSNIGPVGLTTFAAIGLAAAAVVVNHPDWREAAAAGARGFAGPVIYELTKSRVQSWADQRQAEQLTAKA
jgi:type IV secretory pathway protease TraF